MENAKSEKEISTKLLFDSLESRNLLSAFQTRYILPNGKVFANSFNKLGWYVFDDGHVIYRTRYKGASNFDGETAEFLNAIFAYFELVAERQEDNELISYFRRKL